jgi:RNA ligase (TIGR02306 family)
MSNSTHKVEVVKLGKVGRHPNAETLDISTVFGYTVVFKENQYKTGDLVAFVPPDNVMPQTEEYEWLGPKRLVRAKKIRGIPSYGLLLKPPEWAKEGDDLCEHFGVTHYEPAPEDFEGGKDDNAPKKPAPIYDLETIKKYSTLFEDGELINAFEKIHGENMRVTWDEENQVMKVSSHYRWKEKSDRDVYWKTVKYSPEVEACVKAHPDIVIYGESTGGVGGFDYGVPKGERRLLVFDVMKNGQWMDYQDAKTLTEPFGVNWCPIVRENHPFNLEELTELAEDNSRVPGANHISEGLVISPVKNRRTYEVGRLKLKLVSCNYLSKKVK